jgi:hypothetical protein
MRNECDVQAVTSQDAGNVPALAFARSRSYAVWPANAACGRRLLQNLSIDAESDAER